MTDPLPFSSLEKELQYSFTDKKLLELALTHRSAVRGKSHTLHNERLEFLGDAVLELIVTEYLYHLSDKPEGELTNWRSVLVKGETLAAVAREIQLGQYLILSRGEEASGGREKESTLANAVEALIGALYLDSGYEVAKTFCKDHVISKLDALLAKGQERDHKSRFQEVVQEKFGITPHYDLADSEGPDHNKIFTCSVWIGEKKIAEGTGASKQKAEQEAAKKALPLI